jgi:hypothetical protein
MTSSPPPDDLHGALMKTVNAHDGLPEGGAVHDCAMETVHFGPALETLAEMTDYNISLLTDFNFLIMKIR